MPNKGRGKAAKVVNFVAKWLNLCLSTVHTQLTFFDNHQSQSAKVLILFLTIPMIPMCEFQFRFFNFGAADLQFSWSSDGVDFFTVVVKRTLLTHYVYL